MGTAKVSISVSEADLRWVRRRAKKHGRSVSAEFAEALRELRQTEARRRLLDHFGDVGRLTDEDRAAIDAEWAGSPSTPAR